MWNDCGIKICTASFHSLHEQTSQIPNLSRPSTKMPSVWWDWWNIDLGCCLLQNISKYVGMDLLFGLIWSFSYLFYMLSTHRKVYVAFSMHFAMSLTRKLGSLEVEFLESSSKCKQDRIPQTQLCSLTAAKFWIENTFVWI